MEGSKISLTYAVMLYCLVSREVAALTCACPQCNSGYCNVNDGGSCFTFLHIVDGVKLQPLSRGCYDDAFSSSVYCGMEVYSPANGSTPWQYLKIACCDHEDFCNQNLSPTVPPNIPSKPDSKLVCHTYNSKKSDYKSFCETDGGFCYWLVRKNETDITQWKQGCSETCEPEDRNRVVKHCCNTSKCNQFPQEEDIANWGIDPTSSSVPATPTSRSYPPQTSPSPANGGSTSEPMHAEAKQEFSPYVTASVALAAAYFLIVIVLVALVMGVCIRQRQFARILQDKMSIHSRSTSSTSV